MFLFVYGTLKQGFHNHHVLGDNAKYISEGVVFGLRLHEGPGFPYAFKTNDYTNTTIGEVYEIDDVSFARCDRLEGYPRHYTRSMVEVITSAGKVNAWVYHKPTPPDYPVIMSGIWRG